MKVNYELSYDLTLDSEDKGKIEAVLCNQVRVHKATNTFTELCTTRVYILVRAIGGIQYVKSFPVKEKKKAHKEYYVPCEKLDTSSVRLGLRTEDTWNLLAVLCATFTQEGIHVKESPREELKKIKVRSPGMKLHYGVCTGQLTKEIGEVIEVTVDRQDMVDLPYKTLRDMVSYAYTKETGVDLKEACFLCVLLK